MMKFNKKIIGVFILLLLLTGFYVYRSFSNVEAGSDQTNQSTPTQCTEDKKDQLNMHYGVQVDWSEDKKSVKISSQHGAFRIIGVSENAQNMITKQLVSDGVYYSFADGSESVASPDKYITLTFSEAIEPGDKVEINLALAEPSSPCGSYGDFMSTKTGNYYATGLMEIAIPAVNAYTQIANTQYNSDACKELRNPGEAYEFYSKALSYCFSEQVDFNLNDTELAERVSNVKAAYNALQTTATNPYVTGDFNKDWTIGDARFEEIRTKALAAGHVYDVDNGNWYEYANDKPAAEEVAATFTTAIFGKRCIGNDVYYVTWCQPETVDNPQCYATRKNGSVLPEAERFITRNGSGLYYCDDKEDTNIVNADVSLKCSNKPISYDDSDPTNPDTNDFSNLTMYYYLDDAGEKHYTNVTTDLPEDEKIFYNIDANTDYYFARSMEVTKSYSLEYDAVTKEVSSGSMTNRDICNSECDANGGTDEEIASCKERCDIRSRDQDVCNRKCEEAVEIKYGPPIASQAGLCFEYQIQVTSRVKCTGEVTAPYPEEPKVCTPVPYCNSIPGYVHQAGPTTEYENCISSCDGGQYSAECSESCYNKVYGEKSSVNVAKTAFKNTTTSAKKLANCGLFDGSYVISPNGNISWKSADGCGNTYARYYGEFEHDRTVNDHGMNSYLPFDGFKKHVSGGNVTCSNNCSFSGCGSNDILNREDAANYYKQLVDEYTKAVKGCIASASCTTKTATFTIKASYKDGEGNVQTVNYPYSDADRKDELTSKKEKTINTEETNCSKENLLDYLKGSDPHTLINYGGCYENTCGGIDEYHAHWSFPGTYRNRKSRDYIYVDKSDDKAWTAIPNKFCLIKSAQSVNLNWWKRFYLHYGLDMLPSKADNDAKEYYQTATNGASFEIAEEDWNIEGETNDFGYFGWKINVKCFYATPCNGDECDLTGSSEPRVRSVDLKELFPANDGTIPDPDTPSPTPTPTPSPDPGTGGGGADPDVGGGGAEPGTGGGATVLSEGRTPGFNWSTYASNEKNPENKSLPEEYHKAVTELGYNVYNGDDHLDYEFFLTPELIGKIRDKIKQENITYRDFNQENIKRHNGVYVYSSPLFRNSGGTLGGLFADCSRCKIPKSEVLGCFNINNYTASKCTPIDDEG